jgi:hypothetical protein
MMKVSETVMRPEVRGILTATRELTATVRIASSRKPTSMRP